MNIKLFDKWSLEGVSVSDPGLKGYISLNPLIVPRSFGRQAAKQFHKSQMNIVERLMNHMFVAGHRGKKHLITSGSNVGKTNTAYKLIKETFRILEERTKKKPIEVLVRAIYYPLTSYYG